MMGIRGKPAGCRVGGRAGGCEWRWRVHRCRVCRRPGMTRRRRPRSGDSVATARVRLRGAAPGGNAAAQDMAQLRQAAHCGHTGRCAAGLADEPFWGGLRAAWPRRCGVPCSRLALSVPYLELVPVPAGLYPGRIVRGARLAAGGAAMAAWLGRGERRRLSQPRWRGHALPRPPASGAGAERGEVRAAGEYNGGAATRQLRIARQPQLAESRQPGAS